MCSLRQTNLDLSPAVDSELDDSPTVIPCTPIRGRRLLPAFRNSSEPSKTSRTAHGIFTINLFANSVGVSLKMAVIVGTLD